MLINLDKLNIVRYVLRSIEYVILLNIN